jgi:hypothetical protein
VGLAGACRLPGPQKGRLPSNEGRGQGRRGGAPERAEAPRWPSRARPATVRQLLEFYELDMRSRGRGEESVGRVEYTRRTIEVLVPELLNKSVSAVTDADVFEYRNRRAREGTVVYQVIDGKKVRARVPSKPRRLVPSTRRHNGAQPGLHGADSDGARRLEDGADDAALCGGDGSDPQGSGGGSEWERTGESSGQRRSADERSIAFSDNFVSGRLLRMFR